ncbi:class I SAM-dependent methyltransferase [Telmatobacter sp. DSM 110680]|uniref:Class I SAM-dependent methyltransferase n=1 Tax=Telmatobacter sp. DSM 110680 TaxID=3036704 RepID=A0AAU7DHZ6_9BACT
MKDILNAPSIYHLFQFCGGFFSARVKAIKQYLELRPGQRLIDIGCGPGHILPKLPRGVFYDGFDTDERYIRFANRHFGHLGTFHCRVFDAAAAKEFGPADGVMMNGVLHHLDDKSFTETASAIRSALRPGGFLFTFDGVYVPDQNAIGKWLLDNDRGKFVRQEQSYRNLLERSFDKTEFHVRHDLITIPFSHNLVRVPLDLFISKCTKS